MTFFLMKRNHAAFFNKIKDLAFNHCSHTALATTSVILGGTLMPIMYLPILSVLAW
tara:strand:- start:823 stop:990 length:168 start_codon:yes stop_codon:yes gene_type:complete